MEIKIQQCQNCGSRELRNVLVRDEGQKVYVQCRQCEQLVARYLLANGGYYHAGKNFESFLRSIERDGGLSSARDFGKLFGEIKNGSEEDFQTLLIALNERYGDTPP